MAYSTEQLSKGIKSNKHNKRVNPRAYIKKQMNRLIRRKARVIDEESPNVVQQGYEGYGC